MHSLLAKGTTTAAHARIAQVPCATPSAAAVLAMVLLFAAVPARPQELPSSFSELLPDPAEDAAGAVEAETERPREMTIEEARRSVAEGQQRQRDEYDEWLRSGADAVVPPEEQIIDELRSADSELPPMPDDLDGEITLEREKQEGLR